MNETQAGDADMFVDDQGVLNIRSQELELTMRVTGPAQDSTFELAYFDEAGLTEDLETVARLKRRATLFKASRAWEFYAVMEGCTMISYSRSGKNGNTVRAVSAKRSVGLAQDEDARKVVIFKENGKRSPIFELTLAENLYLLVGGSGTVAKATAARVLTKLAERHASPHASTASTTSTASPSDVEERKVDPLHSQQPPEKHQSPEKHRPPTLEQQTSLLTLQAIPEEVEEEDDDSDVGSVISCM